MHVASPTSDEYADQLQKKTNQLSAKLAEFQAPEPEVFASPASHYRMRAEFRLWHQEQDAFYAMFPPGNNREAIRVDTLAAASLTINRLMPALLDAVLASAVLRQKLFQVEFLSNQADEAIVSLIYHRQLDTAWEKAARELETELGIHVIGRARKQRLVVSKDFIEERFLVAQRTLRYQHIENSFTQSNAMINTAMLNWLYRLCQQSLCSDGKTSDCLELYCGNANFTLPLAMNFRQVLATEISKLSVRAARANIALNGFDNIRLVRMAAHEVAEALAGTRPFRRLKGIELETYQFSTVFVDPPRAGLDAQSLDFVQGFDTILYVSCSVDSLSANLEQLSQSHEVSHLALFDQFPFTEHIECGVCLRRRQAITY